MDIKEILDETGWSLIEILKRINSFPYVTEKITEDTLSNMTKEEFMKFLLGKKGDDLCE
ncbi:MULTISPECIES: hypothetical protein [Staphylococcus]|uniref:hypothetical protein n=1 Tax=Staphylococcus TaxID=1279 RepID=UPI000A5A7E07|nr:MULTISPECIES: hypothetical protein [Staphylococcus]MBV5137698.1 hypothetical protein [Staphylococcus chromogenes]MBV5191115.1 hypothetical protein [Staphylococcus chromogenes]MBW3131644.1 hypothetical protein [Staphylococcus chromogenes]MBW6088727.1 hypothetical protein [Staphylococcus chromogenes]MCD9061825.1 hypothetical protein [Staphylococcus chromogenes]